MLRGLALHGFAMRGCCIDAGVYTMLPRRAEYRATISRNNTA